MQIEIAAPLVAVLDLDVRQEASWLKAFDLACTDCIEQVNRLRQSMVVVDRDVNVCLDVICNSLDWASHEARTVDEAHAVLLRVVEVADSIARLV